MIVRPPTAPPTIARPSGQRFRFEVNAYFLLIAFATLVYGVFLQRWSRPWIISDWLINYQAGFVRRGLPGEVLFRLDHLLPVSPVLLVVALTLALYAVILLSVRSLALHSSGRLWVLLLLLSPATLSFPVLDSEAGFRKELLYLAALLVFILLLRRGKLSPVLASAYLACVLCVTVFSHESLVCYAPYFFAALVLGGRSVGQAARQCALPFALAAGAAYVCSHHLGTLQTATRICASLGYPLTANEHGRQVCDGGAIAYLGYTKSMARQETLTVMHAHHYLLLYPVLAALALLPLATGTRALLQAGRRRELQVLWASALLSLGGTGILFVYAIDWGRWIYLHVFSIGVLLLYLDQTTGQRTQPHPVDVPPPAEPSLSRRLGYALLVAAYAAAWSLPHYQVEDRYRFGYIGLAQHVFLDRHSIQGGSR